eukprot:gene15778-17371_t
MTFLGDVFVVERMNCYGVLNVVVKPDSIMKISAIVSSCMSMPVAGIATLGNSLFLYILYKVKRLRTAQNMLLVFLALTDLIVGFLAIPSYAALGVLHALEFKKICLLEVTLKCVSHMFGGMSLFGIVFLLLDRCFAVAFPLKRMVWQLKNKYIVSLFLCSSSIISVGICWQVQALQLPTIRVVIITVISLFMLIGIVCNIIIFAVLWKRHKKVQNMTANAETKKTTRSAHTSGYLALMFVIAYLPRSLVLVTEENSPLFYHVIRWTSLSVYANSALNPLIYFHRRAEFRAELKTVATEMLRRISNALRRNSVSQDN